MICLKEELLEILKKIENEIDSLSEHGDIPHDAYWDISNLIKEAKGKISE